MRLIGIKKLNAIKGVNDEIDTWMSAWVAEIIHVSWKSDMELIDAFPRVEHVENFSYMFPVFDHDHISIKVTFCFNGGIAVIHEVISK
ncbi:hypothetical protein [Shewanella morhuae]|uniref:Uncharacterized protein n=1 Tax=Shewanella morhuae TaxID=365591 RepID=A0A380ALD2_9GAMM|nr:hypothetical protein [Shewanella morhuae]SUI83267.1 Uncharacterised protein [Shewanella morhuae]